MLEMSKIDNEEFDKYAKLLDGSLRVVDRIVDPYLVNLNGKQYVVSHEDGVFSIVETIKDGVMSYAATGDIYEGYFQNDEITGSGTFKYANGDVYEGGFINSLKHGNGKFTYANGNSYVGNFENDVRSGKGVFKWASGASYDGYFKNDLKDGYGIMIYESGDKYEGYFKEDKSKKCYRCFTTRNGCSA